MVSIIMDKMVEGYFLKRLSRFSALAEIADKVEKVYVPNSGRMKELLVPGVKVYVALKEEPHRKTCFDLLMVDYQDILVNIDSRLPNEIIYRNLLAGQLEPFKMYDQIKKEAKYGNSRLDFKLENGKGLCYVEVKSVNLVVDGTARFPDAPTPRGTRHLMELSKAVQEGQRGAVIFVILREDASFFSTNDTTDPIFGETLRRVIDLGVEVYAYDCKVAQNEITLNKRVDVRL